MASRDGWKLTVAVAQIASAAGDLDANLRTHRDALAAARAVGADVVVFPELSLVGHAAGAEAPRLALAAGSTHLRALAETAGDMLAVVGFVEEAPGALYFNSVAALRNGRVVAVHRKINLATYGRIEDGKYFGAGSRPEAFEVASPWRATMLICSDLWSPPLVHLSALAGATLLLAPISSGLEAVGAGFDNPGGWDVTARFHAMTYGLPVALANRVGSEAGLTFWGGSRILDPFGRTLAQAGADEGLVTARLDYAELRQARFLLPTLRDAAASAARLARELDRIAEEVTACPTSC